MVDGAVQTVVPLAQVGEPAWWKHASIAILDKEMQNLPCHCDAARHDLNLFPEMTRLYLLEDIRSRHPVWPTS